MDQLNKVVGDNPFRDDYVGDHQESDGAPSDSRDQQPHNVTAQGCPNVPTVQFHHVTLPIYLPLGDLDSLEKYLPSNEVMVGCSPKSIDVNGGSAPKSSDVSGGSAPNKSTDVGGGAASSPSTGDVHQNGGAARKCTEERAGQDDGGKGGGREAEYA